jgi:hypothetical protein
MWFQQPTLVVTVDFESGNYWFDSKSCEKILRNLLIDVRWRWRIVIILWHAFVHNIFTFSFTYFIIFLQILIYLFFFFPGGHFQLRQTVLWWITDWYSACTDCCSLRCSVSFSVLFKSEVVWTFDRGNSNNENITAKVMSQNRREGDRTGESQPFREQTLSV